MESFYWFYGCKCIVIIKKLVHKLDKGYAETFGSIQRQNMNKITIYKGKEKTLCLVTKF